MAEEKRTPLFSLEEAMTQGAPKSKMDTTDKLLRLVGKYLEEKGGKGLIAGPVCIIQFPGSTEANFYVAVKVLGRKPPKYKPETEPR